MRKSSVIFGILLLIHIPLTYAQEQEQPQITNPPIIIETLFGTYRFNAQVNLNKSLRAIPKVGILSASEAASRWGEENSMEMMNQIHGTYQFHKEFKLLAGFHHTPFTGLRPSTGLAYSYNNKSYLFTTVPRVDLVRNSNAEFFAMTEYKPAFSPSWSLYTRAQALYVVQLRNGDHERSYFILRAGLMRKDFRFGLGVNFDGYGPERYTTENYGIFIGTTIFN